MSTRNCYEVLLFHARPFLCILSLFLHQPRAVAAKTADGSGVEHTTPWAPDGYKSL